MDQVKEDQTEKASRSELLVHPAGIPCRNFGVQLFSSWQAAASLFNAASSDNTAEQQAAEDALREAMLSTPSRVRCAPLCSYRACARLARYIFRSAPRIGQSRTTCHCHACRISRGVQKIGKKMVLFLRIASAF
jgi:hypothetical protein